jgi:hypothetical protein
VQTGSSAAQFPHPRMQLHFNLTQRPNRTYAGSGRAARLGCQALQFRSKDAGKMVRRRRRGGEEARSPTIKGIFAIITLVKFTLDPLLSPNLVPCSLRVCLKVFVSFSVIAVDRVLCRFNRIVIAIV